MTLRRVPALVGFFGKVGGPWQNAGLAKMTAVHSPVHESDASKQQAEKPLPLILLDIGRRIDFRRMVTVRGPLAPMPHGLAVS